MLAVLGLGIKGLFRLLGHADEPRKSVGVEAAEGPAQVATERLVVPSILEARDLARGCIALHHHRRL